MQHDDKWLKDNNGFHPESGVNEASDWDVFAREYHEHMETKRESAYQALLSNLPEFECVNCNYAFKGPMMCKCGLRITAEMRDAILHKHDGDDSQVPDMGLQHIEEKT